MNSLRLDQVCTREKIISQSFQIHISYMLMLFCVLILGLHVIHGRRTENSSEHNECDGNGSMLFTGKLFTYLLSGRVTLPQVYTVALMDACKH